MVGKGEERRLGKMGERVIENERKGQKLILCLEIRQRKGEIMAV